MRYVFNDFNGDWENRRVKRMFWMSVILVDFAIILFILYLTYFVGPVNR